MTMVTAWIAGWGAVEVGAMPGELRAAAVLAVGKETGGSLSPK